MSSVHEAAPTVNAGQQLIELYQRAWLTRAALWAVGSPLKPAFGLEESAKDMQLTQDALTAGDISSDTLATVGRNGLEAYFHALAREDDRQRLSDEKTEAEQAVLNHIQMLSGKRVEVAAVQAGDKPIAIKSDPFRGNKARRIASATGIFVPQATYDEGFNSGSLLLDRPKHRRYLNVAVARTWLKVSLQYHPDSTEPRVFLTVEE